MDRIAQHYRDEAIKWHQRERKKYLDRVAALVAVAGQLPTQRDYVVYHAYHMINGEKPLPYKAWVEQLGGTDERGVSGSSSAGHVQEHQKEGA